MYLSDDAAAEHFLAKLFKLRESCLRFALGMKSFDYWTSVEGLAFGPSQSNPEANLSWLRHDEELFHTELQLHGDLGGTLLCPLCLCESVDPLLLILDNATDRLNEHTTDHWPWVG